MKLRFSGQFAAAGGALVAVALVAGVAHSDLDRPDARPRPKPVVKKPPPGVTVAPAGKDATYRGSFARTGEGAGKIASKPKVLWTAKAGGDIGYPGQPIMADGMVFSGSRDSAIFAFDAASGRERWSYPTGGGVYTSPTWAGGVVYAGSYDRKLYAIDARSGDKRWTFETEDMIEGAVCVMGGMVFVPSFDEKLYALDEKTGKKKWAYEAGGPIRSTPACVGDTVYIGADVGGTGRVTAVNRASGKRRWEHSLERGDAVTLAVAVAGKTGLIAGTSGRVYAFDAGSGKRKWSAMAPGEMNNHAVAVGAGLVVACTNGGCAAYDLGSGAEKWENRKAGNVNGAPAYGDGFFYAPRNVGGDSEVIALDAKSGKIVWTLDVEGTSRTSIGLFDGVLLHGTEIGNLYAIGREIPMAWGTPGKDPGKSGTAKKKGPPPEIPCGRKLAKGDIPAFPLRGWVDGRSWEFADGAAVKKGADGDLFLVNHPYKTRCSVEFSDPDDSVEVGVFLGRVGKGVYASKDVDFMNYRSPDGEESKDGAPNIVVSIDDGDFSSGGWVSGSLAACFEDGSWIGGEFSVPVCRE